MGFKLTKLANKDYLRFSLNHRSDNPACPSKTTLGVDLSVFYRAGNHTGRGQIRTLHYRSSNNNTQPYCTKLIKSNDLEIHPCVYSNQRDVKS